MKTLLLLSALSFLSTAGAQSSPQERDYQSLRVLFQSTKDLSNSYLYCKTAKACDAIPLGSKGCGGPSDYVVVSSNNRNLPEVRYLARRTKEREEEYNRTYQGQSDCEYIEKPETDCVDHVCVQAPVEEGEG